MTLDSHHPLHIAHPAWYKNSQGESPNPFTLMRGESGRIVSFDPSDGTTTGEWFCSIPMQQSWTLEYLKKLKESGRYSHCIWNPHCLIGSDGYAVYEPLFRSLCDWAVRTQSTVDYITKGSNPKTEHFSAFRSEVVDDNDPSTEINSAAIQDLIESSEVLLTGEALNFCVANTIIDAIDFAGDSFLSKLVLLEDCTSSIPGFEHLTDAFYKKARVGKPGGMRVSNTKDYFA